MVAAGTRSEVDDLVQLSARLGGNPLLVQGGAGNTSVKLNGTLWIKASGKWLARANSEPILTPVDLATSRRLVEQGTDSTHCSGISSNALKPSIETAMHAVLPHRVVVHVHSVNTIAWAVRDDARAALEVPLAGLDWAWIPYVASGIPLAHAIAARLVSRPHTSVFVLGNHGLVIGAESCRDAEMLLEDVERRLAIHPRGLHQADIGRLVCRNPGWRLPEDGRTHALGTDPLSRRIISGGILYPCQALFLGGAAVPICGADGTGYAVPAPAGRSPVPVFAVIEDYGVVVRSAITHAESEMFRGFVNVVQRIPSYSVIRYLAVSEVRAVEHNLSNYVTNQRGDCIARDVNGALA